jgi:hypothetical protein
VGQFRGGATLLLKPRVLLPMLLLSAAYLIAGAAGLHVVVGGLGMTSISFADTLAVYFFGLAVGLLLPIPVDIGVIEISSVGALLAVGGDGSLAIAAVLLYRVLSVLCAAALGFLTMLAMPHHFRSALRSRGTVRTHRSTQLAAGCAVVGRRADEPASHEGPIHEDIVNEPVEV